MSFVLDVLGALGVGQSVMVAAMLGLAAWYLIKGATLGRAVGSILTSGVGYLVAILAVGAVGIGLGWIDPDISTATEHVSGAVDAVWSAVGDWIVDQLTKVIP